MQQVAVAHNVKYLLVYSLCEKIARVITYIIL